MQSLRQYHSDESSTLAILKKKFLGNTNLITAQQWEGLVFLLSLSNSFFALANVLELQQVEDNGKLKAIQLKTDAPISGLRRILFEVVDSETFQQSIFSTNQNSKESPFIYHLNPNFLCQLKLLAFKKDVEVANKKMDQLNKEIQNANSEEERCRLECVKKMHIKELSKVEKALSDYCESQSKIEMAKIVLASRVLSQAARERFLSDGSIDPSSGPLSSLPDDVLIHIASFVSDRPIENADTIAYKHFGKPCLAMFSPAASPSQPKDIQHFSFNELSKELISFLKEHTKDKRVSLKDNQPIQKYWESLNPSEKQGLYSKYLANLERNLNNSRCICM